MTRFTEIAKALEVGVQLPGSKSTVYKNFISYVNDFFRFAVVIGVALTVLMIIYAGIKYMLSQGNQTQIGEAKDILVNSIVGLIILLLAALILRSLGVKII